MEIHEKTRIINRAPDASQVIARVGRWNAYYDSDARQNRMYVEVPLKSNAKFNDLRKALEGKKLKEDQDFSVFISPDGASYIISTLNRAATATIQKSLKQYESESVVKSAMAILKHVNSWQEKELKGGNKAAVGTFEDEKTAVAISQCLRTCHIPHRRDGKQVYIEGSDNIKSLKEETGAHIISHPQGKPVGMRPAA